MKQEFDPQEWLDKEKAEKAAQSARSDNQSTPQKRTTHPSGPFASADNQSGNPVDIALEVNTVVTRIEANLADIATSYSDWINVGFAFVNEFGEAGREYFKRVSRFYPGYTLAECNKKYDQCLKSQGKGITIKTFFYLAHQAGIEINTNEAGLEHYSTNSEAKISKAAPVNAILPDALLPTFPDAIFEELPDFFRRIFLLSVSKEERDILLLGSLVTLSSCLNSFKGYYDRMEVHPNLYLYVTAPASAGKGRLILCKNLVNPIHWEKRKQAHQELIRYEMDLKEFNATKSKDLYIEKPEKPRVKMLFIPANNSTTGFFQILSDNEGKGLIFETEGDTISQAFKTDYGNFSDGLRKAFHHESISYYRRTDREYVEVNRPCLSTVLSSTIGQIQSLIPSIENGLASRFMFYFMNVKEDWKNVFATASDESLSSSFNRLGQEFFTLSNSLAENEHMEFELSKEQQDQFNDFFSKLQSKYIELNGLEFVAIIRRLGLTAFRIMMVLSAMRIPETGDFSTTRQCHPADFYSTLSMVNVLARHASFIVSQLPENIKIERALNKKERFFESLPDIFNRKTYLELGKSITISESAAQSYIAKFCEKGLIVRDQRDTYIKTSGVQNKNEPVGELEEA